MWALSLSSRRLSLWKTAAASVSSSGGIAGATAARCRSLSSSSSSALVIMSTTHTDPKCHHHHRSPPPFPRSLVATRIWSNVTTKNCTYFTSTTTAAATAQQNSKIRLPPNLTIDANSSFAPQVAFKKKKNQQKLHAKKQQQQQQQIPLRHKEKEDEEKTKEESDTDVDSTGRKDYDYDSDDEEEEEEELFLTPRDVQYAIPLPERLHVPIHTLFAPQYNSHVGTIWLNETIFGCNPIRIDLMQQVVVYFRNKKRGIRKAVTKTISEVSGSGRKLRPQKGQGMARVGHSRPPHYRGGAKAHGPKNTTDYGKTKLNKKVRKLALCHALSQKLLEGNLIIWNQLHDDSLTHKTSDLAKLLQPWQIGGRNGSSALILDHYHPNENDDENDNDKNKDEDTDTTKKTTSTTTTTTTSRRPTSYNGVPTNLWVAATNLNRIKVSNDHGASVYDILKYEKLILTLSALQQIQNRLKNV